MEGRDDRVRALRLHTDYLNARVNLLDAGRNARNQAAAARRHKNHIDCRQVGKDFQRNGALSGHHVLIVKGVDKLRALFVHNFACLGIRFVVDRAVQHHLGAVALGRGDFGDGRRARHDDRGRYADLRGGKGHALRVVARRRSHNGLKAALLITFHDLVVCTAHLKRAGFLLVFVFQIDLRARHFGEGLGRGKRDGMDDIFEAAGSRLEVVHA